MKKKVFGRKLSRESDTRSALFRGLTTSLIEHEKIVTTKAKALAVVPFAEKVLRMSRLPSLSQKRRLYGMLANKKDLVDSLISKINKDYPLSGKMTTMVNLPDRKGDSAKIAILSVAKGLFVNNKITGKLSSKENKTSVKSAPKAKVVSKTAKSVKKATAKTKK